MFYYIAMKTDSGRGSMRDFVGIILCIASAALGALVITSHWHLSMAQTLVFLSLIWSLIGMWLGNQFTRESWARLDKTVSEIYQEAKLGTLPAQRNSLVWVIEAGGLLLLLTAVVVALID
jgi:hypothetical protein